VKRAYLIILCAILLLVLAACGKEAQSAVTTVPSQTTLPPETMPPPDTTAPPENTKPPETEANPQRFFYDPYIATADAMASLGDDYDLYCDMVESVINYDGKITGFESEQHFIEMWGILLNEFTPAPKLVTTYKTSDNPYDYAEGTVQLHFEHSKEEHDRILLDFETKINEILSLVDHDDGEVEITAKLYQYVSYRMGYAMMYDTLYDRIMNDVGICGDFASYLEILLNYAGIECLLASGYGAGVDHSWVIAKLEGEYYHFDPTWEREFPQWYWFAVSDDLRHNSLVSGWLEAYHMGAEPGEMDKSNLILSGFWNYNTGKYELPPACPNTFREGCRDSKTEPWKWHP